MGTDPKNPNLTPTPCLMRNKYATIQAMTRTVLPRLAAERRLPASIYQQIFVHGDPIET